MTTITDETTARSLLERAIAHDSTPTLDDASVDLLMGIAAVTDPDTSVVTYTSGSLNQAAAVGWNWKSALTADAYDLGGGNGKYLKRDQWFAHCRQMASDYASGVQGVVDGGTGASGALGIESFTAISSTAGYGS